MKEKIVLAPQKGPQEMFLATSADICIYGGAAGGGKTFRFGTWTTRTTTQLSSDVTTRR